MQINPYLNFQGNTEEAFNFYKSVFGGEFEGLTRFKEGPANPKLTPEDLNKIMHIALKIGDSTLMGTDCLISADQQVKFGNSVSMCINPPTKEDADRIFAALSAGGVVEMPLQEMFWGDYFASFTDKYGMLWMISTALKK
jgi:PhnB protein